MVILADCSGSMSLDDVTDTGDVTPTKKWFGGVPTRRTQTRMKSLQQALMELLEMRLNMEGRVSRIALVGFTRECKVRFPRDRESMTEIDGSSPEQVKLDFRDAIGLLRTEEAGTDIGQALHFAAELLHRHGRPGNDRLVVLISDGATWVPKDDDATGEVVSGVDDPVSLMSHLHEQMHIHLHAIGVSKEDIFWPWFRDKYSGREPHISMIPNHQLLDQLIDVGGGDPSRTGDTDVLAEYFSGLGRGVTRQIRCGSPDPLPSLQPWERDALAARTSKSNKNATSQSSASNVVDWQPWFSSCTSAAMSKLNVLQSDHCSNVTLASNNCRRFFNLMYVTLQLAKRSWETWIDSS